MLLGTHLHFLLAAAHVVVVYGLCALRVVEGWVIVGCAIVVLLDQSSFFFVNAATNNFFPSLADLMC